MNVWSNLDMPEFKDEQGQTWRWDAQAHDYVVAGGSPDLSDRVDRGHASGGDNDLFDPSRGDGGSQDGNLFQPKNPMQEGYMARAATWDNSQWEDLVRYVEELAAKDAKAQLDLYPTQSVEILKEIDYPEVVQHLQSWPGMAERGFPEISEDEWETLATFYIEKYDEIANPDYGLGGGSFPEEWGRQAGSDWGNEDRPCDMCDLPAYYNGLCEGHYKSWQQTRVEEARDKMIRDDVPGDTSFPAEWGKTGSMSDRWKSGTLCPVELYREDQIGLPTPESGTQANGELINTGDLDWWRIKIIAEHHRAFPGAEYWISTSFPYRLFNDAGECVGHALLPEEQDSPGQTSFPESWTLESSLKDPTVALKDPSKYQKIQSAPQGLSPDEVNPLTFKGDILLSRNLLVASHAGMRREAVELAEPLTQLPEDWPVLDHEPEVGGGWESGYHSDKEDEISPVGSWLSAQKWLLDLYEGHMSGMRDIPFAREIYTQIIKAIRQAPADQEWQHSDALLLGKSNGSPGYRFIRKVGHQSKVAVELAEPLTQLPENWPVLDYEPGEEDSGWVGSYYHSRTKPNRSRYQTPAGSFEFARSDLLRWLIEVWGDTPGGSLRELLRDAPPDQEFRYNSHEYHGTEGIDLVECTISKTSHLSKVADFDAEPEGEWEIRNRMDLLGDDLRENPVYATCPFCGASDIADSALPASGIGRFKTKLQNCRTCGQYFDMDQVVPDQGYAGGPTFPENWTREASLPAKDEVFWIQATGDFQSGLDNFGEPPTDAYWSEFTIERITDQGVVVYDPKSNLLEHFDWSDWDEGIRDGWIRPRDTTSKTAGDFGRDYDDVIYGRFSYLVSPEGEIIPGYPGEHHNDVYTRTTGLPIPEWDDGSDEDNPYFHHGQGDLNVHYHPQEGLEWKNTENEFYDHVVSDEDVWAAHQPIWEKWLASNPYLSSVASVAGICVKAKDTGRILMLQRSIADDEDPAAGTWEFPGGHVEEGEDPWDGAKREWEEETGVKLPKGERKGSISSGSKYELFFYQVKEEKDVEIFERAVVNPDDPDGDDSEALAWWDPKDAKKNPALRSECKKMNWPKIKQASSVLRGWIGTELLVKKASDDNEPGDTLFPAAWKYGGPIDEDEARAIAAEWHGGQWSDLYAFASSGTILDGLSGEIQSCLRNAPDPVEAERLQQLLEFVDGPQDHTASLADGLERGVLDFSRGIGNALNRIPGVNQPCPNCGGRTMATHEGLAGNFNTCTACGAEIPLGAEDQHLPEAASGVESSRIARVSVQPTPEPPPSHEEHNEGSWWNEVSPSRGNHLAHHREVRSQAEHRLTPTIITVDSVPFVQPKFAHPHDDVALDVGWVHLAQTHGVGYDDALEGRMSNRHREVDHEVTTSWWDPTAIDAEASSLAHVERSYHLADSSTLAPVVQTPSLENWPVLDEEPGGAWESGIEGDAVMDRMRSSGGTSWEGARKFLLDHLYDSIDNSPTPADQPLHPNIGRLIRELEGLEPQTEWRTGGDSTLAYVWFIRRLDDGNRLSKLAVQTLDPATTQMPDINYVLDYNPEDVVDSGWYAQMVFPRLPQHTCDECLSPYGLSWHEAWRWLITAVVREGEMADQSTHLGDWYTAEIEQIRNASPNQELEIHATATNEHDPVIFVTKKVTKISKLAVELAEPPTLDPVKMPDLNFVLDHNPEDLRGGWQASLIYPNWTEGREHPPPETQLSPIGSWDSARDWLIKAWGSGASSAGLTQALDAAPREAPFEFSYPADGQTPAGFESIWYIFPCLAVIRWVGPDPRESAARGTTYNGPRTASAGSLTRREWTSRPILSSLTSLERHHSSPATLAPQETQMPDLNFVLDHNPEDVVDGWVGQYVSDTDLYEDKTSSGGSWQQARDWVEQDVNHLGSDSKAPILAHLATAVPGEPWEYHNRVHGSNRPKVFDAWWRIVRVEQDKTSKLAASAVLDPVQQQMPDLNYVLDYNPEDVTQDAWDAFVVVPKAPTPINPDDVIRGVPWEQARDFHLKDAQEWLEANRQAVLAGHETDMWHYLEEQLTNLIESLNKAPVNKPWTWTPDGSKSPYWRAMRPPGPTTLPQEGGGGVWVIEPTGSSGRLSKVAMPINPQDLEGQEYLYHYAPFEAAPSIIENGLLPADSGQVNHRRHVRPGHVYFWRKPESNYGVQQQWGKARFRVPVSALDPNLIDSDEDHVNPTHMMNTGWAYDQAEQYEEMKPWPVWGAPDATTPLSGPWADEHSDVVDSPEWTKNSLEKGSVAYRGAIPPDLVELDPDWSYNQQFTKQAMPYHWSPEGNREQIEREGLQDQSGHGGIWAWDAPEQAQAYQGFIEDGIGGRSLPGDVWEFGLTDDEADLDEPDDVLEHDLYQTYGLDPRFYNQVPTPDEPGSFGGRFLRGLDSIPPDRLRRLESKLGMPYHVSPQRNRDAIESEGIKTQPQNHGGTPQDPDGVYYWDTEDQAKFFGDRFDIGDEEGYDVYQFDLEPGEQPEDDPWFDANEIGPRDPYRPERIGPFFNEDESLGGHFLPGVHQIAPERLKRLESKTATFGRTMYHVSPRDNRESIRQYGLDPQFGDMSIWLTSDLEATPDLRDPGDDVWEIDIDGLSLEDPPDNPAPGLWFSSNEVIPPERVRLVAQGQKTSMGQRGDLPEGITFEYKALGEDQDGLLSRVHAMLNGQLIGWLSWSEDEIFDINVVAAYRRLGIATAMLQEAERIVGHPIQHSDDLSAQGGAWADATPRDRYSTEDFHCPGCGLAGSEIDRRETNCPSCGQALDPYIESDEGVDIPGVDVVLKITGDVCGFWCSEALRETVSDVVRQADDLGEARELLEARGFIVRIDGT